MRLLFPTIVITILLASLIAAGSVSAQSGAACDQYGCAEGSASCDQYGCTADPAPEGEPAPVERIGPTAGEPATEAKKQVESSAPAEGNVGTSEPMIPETDKVTRKGVANAQYQAIDPTPQPLADRTLTETETASTTPPTQEQVDEIKHDSVAESERSNEANARPETTRSIGEEDEEDTIELENIDGPLPSYPYEGEPCEENDCGLEDVEAPVECATYESGSGKEVYGCSNPKLYEKKGCYEITFYTEDGKPYANLDTCSREKPYAPPEPPKGDFDYFKPPSETIVNQDWDPMLEPAQCFLNNEGEWGDGRKGDKLDPHCGLGGLSVKYDCQVYYSTVHGTVRGCFRQYPGYIYEDPVTGCSLPLHIYDEAGRRIGTYESCPKVRQESCKSAECGISVPRDWTCRREHWDYGTLYDGEKRTFRRCVSPEFGKFLAVGGLPCKKADGRFLAALYDERGHRVYEITCGVGGAGGDLGEWAGIEAEQADEMLSETEDTSQSNPSEEDEIRPEGEGTVASSVTSPPSDTAKSRDLFGTTGLAGSTLAPSTGEEDMQETWPNITTAESSRESDRRFVNAHTTNADEHSLEVQSPANSDKARSAHNVPRGTTHGKHANIHADSTTESDKDSGIKPP